jgi:hypothetical protein
MNYFNIAGLKSKISLYRIDIYALSGYAVLSILLTYPVAFSPDKIPGYGGDSYQFIWFFWWFKKALFTHLNPFFTPMLYYPSGVSLVFSTVTPFNSVLSIPLQLLFGLNPANNLIWLSTFILSGFGGFLVVRYLTGDIRAAFISGLIYSFSPYHFAHALGHMNLVSIQWIPFYIIYLIKTVREEKIKNALIAGIFLFLTAACDYYYLLYLSIFTLIFIVFSLWMDSANILRMDTIKRISIMGITFVIVFSPLLYLLIREMAQSGSAYMYTGGFVEYSADLLAFLIPAPFHPVFGEFVRPVYGNFTGNIAESTIFLGYTCLLLAAIALFNARGKEIRFWVISFILFLILSLGPVLHLYGIFTLNVLNHATYIPLPYTLLMNIPVFSIARVPSRWNVLVMFSLAVLAGYGLCILFSKLKHSSSERIASGNIVALLIAVLILFEFAAVPFPMTNPQIPNIYYQMREDGTDYAILELPLTTLDSKYMYYQIVHQKYLVNGYVSRTPEYATEFIHSTTFISQLCRELSSSIPENDILDENLSEVGSSVLRYYNIKYVLLHQNFMSEEEFNHFNLLLRGDPGLSATMDPNHGLVIYHVKDGPIKPFITLDSGWHDLENWSGTPGRWMKDDATILVYSDKHYDGLLQFRTYSFYQMHTLEILVRDHIVSEVTIPTSFVSIEVPVTLEEGENLIQFHVLEGGTRPSDIQDLGSTDKRSMSLGMQHVAIIPLKEETPC